MDREDPIEKYTRLVMMVTRLAALGQETDEACDRVMQAVTDYETRMAIFLRALHRTRGQKGWVLGIMTRQSLN